MTHVETGAPLRGVAGGQAPTQGPGEPGEYHSLAGSWPPPIGRPRGGWRVQFQCEPISRRRTRTAPTKGTRACGGSIALPLPATARPWSWMPSAWRCRKRVAAPIRVSVDRPGVVGQVPGQPNPQEWHERVSARNTPNLQAPACHRTFGDRGVMEPTHCSAYFGRKRAEATNPVEPPRVPEIPVLHLTQ